MVQSKREPDPAIESAAAQWLAKLDRGVSATERAEYLQWLQRRPEHAITIAQLELAWNRLDRLRQLQPAPSVNPDPDLLTSRGRPRWVRPTVLAIAAAIAVVGIGFLTLALEPVDRPATLVKTEPERLLLPDNSLVELNSGAEVRVDFGAAQRTVHLVRGEAHFAVVEDAQRPFVVEVEGYRVRAVGTAFSVRLSDAAVAVLVTDGKVDLGETSGPASGETADVRELSRVVAGQEAVVQMQPAAPTMPRLHVRNLTPEEIERALAWQKLRLEFVDLPLRDVVGAFNRYNSRKLVIADEETAAIVVAGSFRPDGVDPFVRLLEVGFGVRARSQDGKIVLQLRR